MGCIIDYFRYRRRVNSEDIVKDIESLSHNVIISKACVVLHERDSVKLSTFNNRKRISSISSIFPTTDSSDSFESVETVNDV